MIVYMRCGNNTADSVLELFIKAVQTFGLLLRVRGNRGTENMQVADYMNHVVDHLSVDVASTTNALNVFGNTCLLAVLLCSTICLFDGRQWDSSP